MSAEEHPPTGPESDEAPLVFEQPLNERMRTFLRMDFLYNQARYQNERASQWGSRAAVGSLIDMLAVAGRGDVRSDVLKELERHLTQLNDFANRAGVDSARLRAVIANLVRLRGELFATGPAYLQPMRDSEFLHAVKLRSAIPGGTCEFDLPDYFFWLNQDTRSRLEAFEGWLAVFRPLCEAIAEVLWLTRQNGRVRDEVAVGGNFNLSFERDSPVQLLRILLPPSAGLYPETSGSQHRCSVRFLHWNGLLQRPTQVHHDVHFQLMRCG
ncbi:MAG: hypothetical protein RL026_533 [Pseudomonadota bacterium]|jgi:cell division protein ZapD